MSRSDTTYRIADEPRPTRLGRLAINPFYILLLTMIFYIFLGPVWLVFNSFAMGSPRAWRELLVVIGGIVVFFLLLAVYVFVSVGYDDFGLSKEESAAYLGVAIKAYWIAVCYWLFISQMRVYPILQYFRARDAGRTAGG